MSLLTLSVTQACVEYFRGGGILHYKYVWKILSAFQTAADSLPAMTSVDVPELCRLTVVGDLHGQVRVCARLCVLFAFGFACVCVRVRLEVSACVFCCLYTVWKCLSEILFVFIFCFGSVLRTSLMLLCALADARPDAHFQAVRAADAAEPIPLQR